MIAGVATLLALLATAPQEPRPDLPDWIELYAQLSELEGRPEGVDRRLGLELLKETAAEHADDARARVLAAQVARLSGAELPALELTREELDTLSGEVSWRAAQVLAPERGQDAAVLRALAELPEERVPVAFPLGYERFVALDTAYRAPEAQRIAAALHARAKASWSASNLALLERRLGRTEEAVRVLTQQLERTVDAQEEALLLQDRALAWLGGGFEARARVDLGASIARGSPDAGVVVGRLALGAGEMERARAVLRPLVRTEPPQDWALRGWGLSMLPSNRARL